MVDSGIGVGGPVAQHDMDRAEQFVRHGNDGALVAAAAQAFEVGIPLRFEGLFAGEVRRRVSLPGYPFQRRRFRIASAPR